MPYDPDDIFTAEPKLLSLDCFPVLSIRPLSPPEYDLVMAANARYQHLPDANRVSMESQSQDDATDASLLLLDPMRSSIEERLQLQHPKKSYNFTAHPTLFFRSFAVVLLITSFVMFIVSEPDTHRNIPAIILTCFAFVRNILVILHHLLSTTLRIRFSIEFRNRRPRSAKSKRSYPGWLKQGLGHFLLDSVLVMLLLIMTIVSNKAPYIYWRYNGYSGLHLPACVLSYIGL